MKKSIIFFTFVLACVLSFSLFFTNNPLVNKQVFAQSRFDGQRIVVVGKGEIEVEPDTVKVSFGLRTRAESLSSGQTKIRESIADVTNKIKESNKNADVYTNYLSSYPVYENGLLAYEFDCCLIAKSSDVANANSLVDAVVNAGATSVRSVNYLLENKEEAYIKALISAKENAENKVKAIYENATLKGLKEEAVYNYCEGSHGEKIKITAKVNACYEVGGLKAEESSLNNAFNTSSTSTTATQAKLNQSQTLNENNITKKEETKEISSVLNESKINKNNETTTSQKTNQEVVKATAVETSSNNITTLDLKSDVNLEKSNASNFTKDIKKDNTIIDINGNIRENNDFDFISNFS